MVHEEGLHTEAVPRSEQHAAAPVVDHEGPHAVEPAQAFRAPLSVGREQDFGVAGGAEAVAGGPQLLPQLDVVVDLAVEDDDKLAILRAHRLMTGGAQVQDGESAKPEPHLLMEIQARIVGAAVSDAPGHLAQDSCVCLATAETEHNDKTAHSREPLLQFVQSAGRHTRRGLTVQARCRPTPVRRARSVQPSQPALLRDRDTRGPGRPPAPAVPSGTCAGSGWSRSCLLW